jgi:hypothetical protein
MADVDLIKCLEYIDPAELDYSTWCAVGMALRHEGYRWEDWDAWSRNDSRYHHGECERKWESFRGSASPVTGATIVQMAKDRGWSASSREGFELDWDSVITPVEGVLY